MIKVIVLPLLAVTAISGALLALPDVQRPVTPVALTAPAVAPTHPEVTELLIMVNNERTKAGITPLVLDSRLVASSEAKCADQAAKNYHAHVAPDGTNWKTFVAPLVGGGVFVGENLSWGYPTSQAAVNGLMGSPLHRAAILNSRFTGVGYAVCATSDNRNFIVQHFVES